jgi:hypothetical protein
MKIQIFLPLLSLILSMHAMVLNSQDHSGKNQSPLITQERESIITKYLSGQIIHPSQVYLSQINVSDEPEFLLNLSVKQNWNGALWIDAWQYAYEYGSNNKVTSLTYSTWYETNWNPYWQTLTAYNDKNKITGIINQFWDGEHWLPNSRLVRNYNENMEETEVINYLYQDGWIESSRLLYNYDTTEFVNQNNDTIVKTTDQITQLWNGYWVDHEKNTTSYIKMAKKYFPVESVTQTYYISYWADKSRLLYKYDSLYNLTEHVQQVPGTAEWANEKRNVSKYDGKNNTEELYQEWGGSGDDTGWKNVKIYLKAYQENAMTEKIYKEWIGSEWLNISRNLYSIANDTVSEDIFQVWSDPDWVNDKLHSYTYDMNKCRTEDLHSRWNGSVWVWWERELYFWSAATSVDPLKTENTPIILPTCYPNPFTFNTSIRYTLPNEGHITIIISNSSGKIIQTLVNENQAPGHYDVMFIPHKIPAGVYFYSLQYDNLTITKKMIYIK